MKIIGIGFKKIDSERKKEFKGQVKINTNMHLESIEKDKIDIAGEVLKFSFVYDIKYDPDFAIISFKGEIMAIVENSKQVLLDWKKKKISEEIRIPLLNHLMSRCNLRALQLEEELGLPPHFPMPRLTKPAQAEQGKANYAG